MAGSPQMVPPTMPAPSPLMARLLVSATLPGTRLLMSSTCQNGASEASSNLSLCGQAVGMTVGVGVTVGVGGGNAGG
jgi:hypothetical protein